MTEEVVKVKAPVTWDTKKFENKSTPALEQKKEDKPEEKK